MKSRKSLTFYKSPRIYYILIGCLIALILFDLWYFNRPASKKTATIPSNTSVGSPVNSQSGSTDQPSRGNDHSSSDNTPAGSTQSNAALITPWGNFISNHHPGQDGSPTAESSACNTTPGATCYIKFTNGSLTRVLDSKIANGQGAVIWTWDVKSAGFSAGTWQVSAVASLGDQTKTSVDATALVIQ